MKSLNYTPENSYKVDCTSFKKKELQFNALFFLIDFYEAEIPQGNLSQMPSVEKPALCPLVANSSIAPKSQGNRRLLSHKWPPGGSTRQHLLHSNRGTSQHSEASRPDRSTGAGTGDDGELYTTAHRNDEQTALINSLTISSGFHWSPRKGHPRAPKLT